MIYGRTEKSDSPSRRGKGPEEQIKNTVKLPVCPAQSVVSISANNQTKEERFRLEYSILNVAIHFH